MAKAAYVGIDEVARRIKNIYIGVPTDIPIYETVTTTNTYDFTYANRAQFFSDNASTATTGWKMSSYNSGGVKLVPNNFGVNSSTATITLTALKNLTNVTIKGIYYTESRYDKITLIVGGTTVLNAVSGTSSTLTTHYTGNLTAGQTIKFTYAKDGSQHATSEASTYFVVDCNNLVVTTTTEELVGYETKEVAKKIKKGYVGIEGIARRCFLSGSIFTYSGSYTTSDVTINGVNYTMWTITGSGTLEVSEPIQYWMCGGGGKGGNATKPTGSGYDEYTKSGGSGGGGGGGRISTGTIASGKYAVTVGAGNSGTSSIGSLAALGGNAGNEGDGGNGNAGGGAGASWALASGESYITTSSPLDSSAGEGEGKNSYPFGLKTGLYAHSAGGGGGADSFGYARSSTTPYHKTRHGGDGGTNGSNGSPSQERTIGGAWFYGGIGGDYGGGNGGDFCVSPNVIVLAGSPAVYYGSGGGGGSRYHCGSMYPSSYNVCASGGNGYQGVIYLLIPVIEET